MSNTSKRRKLSKAEIKAYEARRAAERARVQHAEAASEVPIGVMSAEETYIWGRDEEYSVVRDDLIRLGIIVAILFVILIGLAFVL